MAKYFVSLDKLALFKEKIIALIPTKLSQLTNDNNTVVDASYVHTDQNFTGELKGKLEGIDANANNYTLPTASATVLGGVKIGANVTIDENGKISVTALDWANINGKPVALSEFTNDTGFITKAVTDLVNYYTKSQVYNKTEVEDLISGVKTVKNEVVVTLPDTGESNIIYLVPRTGGAEPDIHDEYIWVTSTSKFEKIGTTQIDLSGYWSNTNLVEATDEQINALFA